jgi:hypothetical protein
VAATTGVTDQPTTAAATAIAAATAPALESPLESPLLPSASPTAVESCLSLIESSGNTVCGFVISQVDGGPVVGRPVFLAEALFSSDGSVVFSALDQNTAPQATTDENGMFSLTDVPSNMYFLMLDEYPQPIMLKEFENSENDLFVDWREDEGAVDLGIILADVPSMPTP